MLKNLIDVISNIDLDKISSLSKHLEICRNKNSSIFVIGNGGMLATLPRWQMTLVLIF